MSYKLKLNDIDRGSSTSITTQLVDRLREAIDAGDLTPGSKLPTTRALAEEASINHLTAVRVYRRLAELGYVTSAVGRGTFVRSVPPPAPDAEERDPVDWQTAVLPDLRASFSNEMFLSTYMIPSDPGIVSLATGAPHPSIFPAAQLGRIANDLLNDLGGEALSYLDPDGLS